LKARAKDRVDEVGAWGADADDGGVGCESDEGGSEECEDEEKGEEANTHVLSIAWRSGNES
jgi:hypothetical protein